jgi:hypothetical protein
MPLLIHLLTRESVRRSRESGRVIYINIGITLRYYIVPLQLLLLILLAILLATQNYTFYVTNIQKILTYCKQTELIKTETLMNEH